MERLHESLTINAPASLCYQKWIHFEEFPHFMTHVDAVWPMAPQQWHWVFKGTLGIEVGGDMEVTLNEGRRSLSWRSLPGGKTRAEGTVRFTEAGPQETQMECDFHYELPTGPLGEALAHFLLNPQKVLQEELQNFRHLVEGTNVPTAKAQVGKTLQPDSFVVPEATSAAAGFSESFREEGEAPGYAGPYGLDSDSDDALLVENREEYPEVVLDLQNIQNEENPYLADEGALHSEDLRDTQAFVAGEEDVDVFTESYDASSEDLENYTEDLDEELDPTPNALPDSLRESP
ncbi:SRPBCC family protein [Vampirovibrio chlorellavorus]|uniref:SRPBCC family protein n=1 Tax=Vampirovibrio chlorellavorus TaxID=758823 RepID=UPI0026F2FB0D|nr:SRPBCC family protein [Vampirovibrio chlorellavorus]